MSVFTVLIIIGAIYQLVTAVSKKKGTPQTPGKVPDPLKLPDVRSIGDVMQGISRGTWKEQLKQALENASYQEGPLASTVPEAVEETKDYYFKTEGNEETQGSVRTSEHIGMLGSEAYKSTAEVPPVAVKEMNPPDLRGIQPSLTQRDLVQGVIWAEILGKPRAMHPYRGPRT